MTDNDKIIAMTRSLAKSLQLDVRYEALRKARENNADNKVLQDAIGDFNLARLNLNNELGKEKADDAKVAKFNQDVQDAYDAVTQNPGMIAYYDAKEEVDKLMNYVLAILNGTVNGSDPDEIEEPDDCTHDCSTCGGCH